MTADGPTGGSRVGDLAGRLREEARRADERRLLVLAGEREATYGAAGEALAGGGFDPARTTLVGERDLLDCERVGPGEAGRLLGTTREAAVLDAHDRLEPNALGRVVGAVDGGGLLVLLTPPLDEWPDRTDDFDRTLAVAPYGPDDVRGQFRRRLVATLRSHDGVAVVDADRGSVERTGLTDPLPRRRRDPPGVPPDAAFPPLAYRACLTADQVETLRALERLRPAAEDLEDGGEAGGGHDGEAGGGHDGEAGGGHDGEAGDGDDAGEDGTGRDGPGAPLPGPQAVVVEADRGRGKSSVAGLAAASLAAAGNDVVVTAPSFRSTRELFARAADLLPALDARETVPGPDLPPDLEPREGSSEGVERPTAPDGPDSLGGPDPHEAPGDGESPRRARRTASGGTDGDPSGSGGDAGGEVPREVASASGGRVRFLSPAAAADRAVEADVVVVDEAAALPVGRLAATLAADRVAYVTTVHGYEGAGRGFSVRFRDRLVDARHAVTDVRMDEPIRYAPGDPVETWAFRALLLDARPPVDQLVAEATPETVEYRALAPPDLVADEHLLREAFGLLVLAHYRTEPDDLARLLDAPNVSVRALLVDGHVVSVALLAREGGLPAGTRAEMYAGTRIRGHMLPDVLTSQLRDEDAGIPVGLRVMRVATHHAVRSRGLGSHLLASIRGEFEPGGGTAPEEHSEGVDWLGVGYGATPELLRFWHRNGFRAVHCSVTRNERSGEHSAIMLDPLTAAGRDLTERHARWFADRAAAMLSDPLDDLDPDVARELLGSIGVDRDPALTDREWRHVAGAAHGAALTATNPGPFRRLVVAHLVDPADPAPLSARQERLLVRAILQGHAAPDVAGAMGFHSPAEALRAVGDALAALVDAYGTDAARAEADRLS